MYLSLYCKGSKRVTQGFTVRGSQRPNRTATHWPPLLWPSALCLSRSPGLLNRRPRGPLCWVRLSLPHLITNWSGPQTPSGFPRAPSAGCGFPYHNSSLTRLSPTVWLPVLTELYSSSTPTQSPTQSLEWHVWSSSSGNNCHAVHRSLSSGASVYECIMGFYLVPFRLPNPPTRSLSITGHWNVSLPSGASLWNGMFGRVEGQNTTLSLKL